MLCYKTDVHSREYPVAGVGGVDPVAARLWRRPSIPDAEDESGLEAKEAGSMMAKRRRSDGNKTEGGSIRQGSLLTRMARPIKGRQRTRRKTKNVGSLSFHSVPTETNRVSPGQCMTCFDQLQFIYCLALIPQTSVHHLTLNASSTSLNQSLF